MQPTKIIKLNPTKLPQTFSTYCWSGTPGYISLDKDIELNRKLMLIGLGQLLWQPTSSYVYISVNSLIDK